MALVDDPKAYILRMFALESREGRGAYCDAFPDGAAPSDMSLESGELIHGIMIARWGRSAATGRE